MYTFCPFLKDFLLILFILFLAFFLQSRNGFKCNLFKGFLGVFKVKFSVLFCCYLLTRLSWRRELIEPCDPEKYPHLSLYPQFNFLCFSLGKQNCANFALCVVFLWLTMSQPDISLVVKAAAARRSKAAWLIPGQLPREKRREYAEHDHFMSCYIMSCHDLPCHVISQCSSMTIYWWFFLETMWKRIFFHKKQPFSKKWHNMSCHVMSCQGMSWL